MTKKILITGSTDGIGLEAAIKLAEMGHHILLHGRNPSKLENVTKKLSDISANGQVESYVADLSDLAEVDRLVKEITAKHTQLDILINNAGVFPKTTLVTEDGLDIVFVVNTIAPYLLTKQLLPLVPKDGRIINLSSAAQSPVNLQALAGQTQVTDSFTAYAQSKLALTMWSRVLGLSLPEGPMVVSVNPGSMLATKMVKDAFGVAGNDIQIGADILVRAALSDQFKEATGLYFDNDSGHFTSPHPDGLNQQKSHEVVDLIEAILADKGL